MSGCVLGFVIKANNVARNTLNKYGSSNRSWFVLYEHENKQRSNLQSSTPACGICSFSGSTETPTKKKAEKIFFNDFLTGNTDFGGYFGDFSFTG